MVPASDPQELAKILSEYPEIRDIFIDGVERPVRRSSSAKNQKKDYSGKKKTHIKKNLAITSENRILALSNTEPGSKHDYRILKESGFMEVFISHALWMDLGFLGVKNDFPSHEIVMPKKKSKKKELTPEEKDDNRVISSIRVKVEHFFARVKSWFVVSHRYRGRLYGNFQTVRENWKHNIMLLICVLCNFRFFI